MGSEGGGEQGVRTRGSRRAGARSRFCRTLPASRRSSTAGRRPRGSPRHRRGHRVDLPRAADGCRGRPGRPTGRELTGDGRPRHDLTQRWVAAHPPPRPPISHKGTFGRVLVVAGSLEYAGAACSPDLGRRGLGRGWSASRRPNQSASACLVSCPSSPACFSLEEAGLVAPAGWRQLTAAARDYDAAVVGPGLGRHAATLRRTARLLAELRRPVVIDADGLTALAARDSGGAR